VGEREPRVVEPEQCDSDCPCMAEDGVSAWCTHPGWPVDVVFNDTEYEPDGYPRACPLRTAPLLVRLPVPDPGGEPKP